MKNNKKKGTITVFISIILSSIFLLAGTFIDATRVSVAHSQIQRANKTALSSLLACYNNDLKEQYGIFGNYVDNDIMQDDFLEYFSKNLNINSGQNYLYDYCIEDYDIETVYSLEKIDIFEEQIMDFMKYRAPLETAYNLIKKIRGVKSISSSSKLYSRKIKTEQQASDIGDNQLLLESGIEKLNKSELLQSIKECKSKFINENMQLDIIETEMNCLKDLFLKEKDEIIKGDMLKNINALSEKISNINLCKTEIKNTITLNIEQYKVLNIQVLKEANTIIEKKDAFLSKLDEEIKYIQNEQEVLNELKEAYSNELLNMKKLIEEDNSDKLIEILEDKVKQCGNINTYANQNELLFFEELNKLNNYMSLRYLFNKTTATESSEKDNRKEAKEALNVALSKKGELKVIEDSLLQQLPSNKLKNVQEDKNLVNLDDNSLPNLLDLVSKQEKILEQILPKVVGELYVNEYVMGMFKHDVPILKGQDKSSSFNIRSEDKNERDAYFSNFEVEYIINGNKSEAMNSKLVKMEILAIRLLANAMHIVSDSSKMSRVTSLAAELSTWSAGLSTPLIQTTLIFSWAMLEAVYDIEMLAKGESIALFKTKNLWKTDISGTIDNKKEDKLDKDFLCLNYQDYIRIFLLVTNKEKKLSRIQDLIQLNIGVSNQGFLLEDCKVKLKLKSTVSIKNMFFLFPSSRITSGLGRSFLSEETYMEY